MKKLLFLSVVILGGCVSQQAIEEKAYAEAFALCKDVENYEQCMDATFPQIYSARLNQEYARRQAISNVMANQSAYHRNQDAIHQQAIKPLPTQQKTTVNCYQNGAYTQCTSQ